MSKRTCYIVVMYLTIIMALSGGVPVMGAPGGGGGNDDVPDYGDQVVLYRDSDTGVPIVSKGPACNEYNDETGECDDPVANSLCLQPIASEWCDECEEPEEGVYLVPLDLDTCTAKPEYEHLQMEVDFGRINLMRSPLEVLKEQLEEALYSLTTAGCLSRDPAGRFVYSTLASDSEVRNNDTSPLHSAGKLVSTTVTSEGEVESHAIDSPLQNLAIFWKIMKDGMLDDNVAIGSTAQEIALTAARGLGASSAKDGEITVDMLSYINEIFGLTEEGGNALFARECIEVRQEVKGVIDVVEKCYLRFDNFQGDFLDKFPNIDQDTSFSYDRSGNFSFLPSPAYIPAGAGIDGWFEYLALEGSTLVVVQGPILGAVPELVADSNLIAAGIGGFVQAADDTRATIEFMHTWEVPEALATPVECMVEAGDWFDLSISEQSGLQVPNRMVVEAEDREMIITVQNAGPAVASGCVSVWMGVGTKPNTGDNGDPPDWMFCFPDETQDLEALAAGFSYSWTRFVPAVSNTGIIYWAAKITDPDGQPLVLDVNSSNDYVEETTTVVSSGGGGGH